MEDAMNGWAEVAKIAIECAAMVAVVWILFGWYER